MFSATLLPIQYYKELLSTEKDDYAVYAETVFEESQSRLLLGTDVSTRYTMRGETMYRRYAEYLYEMASAKEGNYMSFFPSYHFLEQVYDAFIELVGRKQSASERREEYNVGQIECLVQAPYMSEEAREIFLEGFEEEREGSLMGFCVMGGVSRKGLILQKSV